MKTRTLFLGLLTAFSAQAQNLNTNAANTPAELVAAQALLDKHFVIWNEKDPAKRARLIAEVYEPSAFVSDYAQSATNSAELDRMIGKVQAAHATFSFRGEAVTLNHGLGRAPWVYGPVENPTQVRGEDIFTIANGRLSSVRVYINNPHDKVDYKNDAQNK